MTILVHDCVDQDDSYSLLNLTPIEDTFTRVVNTQELEDALFDVSYTHLMVLREEFTSRIQDVINYRCTVMVCTHKAILYKIASEEEKYLELMLRVLKHGSSKLDRTRVGTKSQFGERLKFSLLNDRLPLLTTKRVFVRGVLEELIWFLRGSTDATELSKRNVHIWDRNGSKEQLNALGLSHREEGDLGPVYGFQWRHWGSEYIDKNTKSQGGVDQIANVIEQLILDPDSRRHVVNAWNVSDLNKMALPPCHMCFQFYVRDGKYLSCQMYQRSADLFLGVPFNIASYAFLTHIIAKLTNLIAEELVIVIGDAHVYINHEHAILEQSTRTPYSFPTVCIDDALQSIDNIDPSHVTVRDYKCHPTINAPMAV
jgi:thymidylate synthase